MKRIDFISIHHKANFIINDGPFKGKFCKIAGIDFDTEIIKTTGGSVLPCEIIQPLLRTFNDITDSEALEFCRLYWKDDKVQRWAEGNDKSEYVIPKATDIVRIIEGIDWSYPDFKEILQVVNYSIANNIDVFGGIEKGWAVRLNSVL